MKTWLFIHVDILHLDYLTSLTVLLLLNYKKIVLKLK